MVSSTIANWLLNRPQWLQAAANQLLESGDLNDVAISNLAILCQQEVNNEFPNVDYSIPTGAFDAKDSEGIHLCSISEITGVNRLAPRKPLNFGESNIAVIYGQNGSGKSGYVRLLKHVCGARDRIRGQLHSNVFSVENTLQKAKLTFLKNKNLTEYEWAGSGVCDDLCSIGIFDTSFSQVFIERGDEVSYEPPVLSFFSELIDICEKVTKKLDEQIAALNSKMPSMPSEYHSSTEATWLNKLSASMTTDEIDSQCAFSSENADKIVELQNRISEKSPADQATQFRTKKNYVVKLVKDVQTYLEQLSDMNCTKIIEAINNANLKESTALAAAQNDFSNEKLEGIGSDIWKELWSAARKYSEKVAYIGQEYPYVQDDSVCVLCHQPLFEDAKQRLISFESYIKNETQNQAREAANEAKQAIDSLPDIPSPATLKTIIDAAGIENQDIVNSLNDTVTSLQDRKSKLLSPNPNDALRTVIQPPNWIEGIQDISSGYEKSASTLDEDAKRNNRHELQSELNNLNSKKWLSDNKIAIQEELKRLKSLKQLQEAKKKTNSQALSKKKGELTETLITDAFVQRFNQELEALGASRLKVKLTKSNVSRGKAIHKLTLDEASLKLNEILSEGELRILSIASFLADVTGRTYPVPFVFDDPISSLDQDYEEAVIQRLCAIASERQVIIFTHRLSLLGMVQDYAKEVSIKPKIICIREESWGTGEPGISPLFAMKPNNALNQLINELTTAKKLLGEEGREVYDPYVKALCSDFRILLERTIEYELMSDIVQRYRRAINTKGKLHNLAKISETDCKYFDDMMTKYSRYEHSQPLEAPVTMPDPGELQNDFIALRDWQQEFNKRSLT